MNGKRVVILGGTSGIGLATAKAAQREGASVVVASSRRQRVDSALSALRGKAEGEVVDLSDEGQVRAFFDRVRCVRSPGLLRRRDAAFADVGKDDARPGAWLLQPALLGRVMAVKYGSPHIRSGGSITLTNGVAGLRPQMGWTMAASICGAMEALTRALAVELAPIRVNAVCPGVVKTELWSDMPGSDRQAMYSDIGRKLPVGRVGEADDLAQAYIYLMRQGYSTGQVIVVDGGAVLV